ncbi:HORMA-1 domain-containing protein [Lentzea aerocolonigenes]|uniref:HORMA-1 domain-containing protein n=1 Tax=Lentzea aerocolonigenes TaxID=68170 RepID=UPI0004C32C62|nr:hypothetical protein [Lentzea aerocolonigenes]MCP2242450.1 hypothetical protein [Lentzea aerocolonigenes]
MTRSLTRSSSYTITDARYVGAKIGADLRQLRAVYGKPADLDLIDRYVEEVALLLNQGYLDTVDYGFRDATGNVWKLRMRYRASFGGHLVDNPPGRLPRTADVATLPFHSFLTYSPAFHALPPSEQHAFKETLPISRTTGTEPGTGSSYTAPGHGYGRNGIGVTRDVYVASEY